MSMESSDFSEREYTDGRTKQAFKDACDINKILKRAAIKGGLSHVQKYDEAVYGEFDPDLDLFVARDRIAKAEKIFMDLPAEVRREFDNDPVKFVQYGKKVGIPKLIEEIPAIAEPGDYFPNPVRRADVSAAAAANTPEPPVAPSPPADSPQE